jgi:hypothetical protein
VSIIVIDYSHYAPYLLPFWQSKLEGAEALGLWRLKDNWSETPYPISPIGGIGGLTADLDAFLASLVRPGSGDWVDNTHTTASAQTTVAQVGVVQVAQVAQVQAQTGTGGAGTGGTGAGGTGTGGTGTGGTDTGGTGGTGGTSGTGGTGGS